jgi:hypothetical protein
MTYDPAAFGRSIADSEMAQFAATRALMKRVALQAPGLGADDRAFLEAEAARLESLAERLRETATHGSRT